MSNKVDIVEGLLGDLSTAYWGVVTFADRVFHFNKKKWRDKIDKISTVGGNMVRVLPYSLYGTPSIEQVFCPWQFDYSTNRFDLDKFSDNYFDIVSEAAALASTVQPDGPNVSLWYELFDDCGFRPEVIHLQPWTQNIQGISTMYDDTLQVYRYVEEVIRRLAGRVKMGLGNELNMNIGVMQPAWKGTRMFGRIFSMFKTAGVEIFSYGTCVNVPGEEANYSALKGMQGDAEIVLGVNEMIRITRPVHNIALGGAYILKPCYWWGHNAHAAIFSDDGVHPRPGAVMWQDMVRYILDNYDANSNLFGMAGKVRVGFEHCAKTEDWNYEASIISAIAQEIEKNFGPGTPANIVIENRGKWIDPYVEPQPPIPPEPPVPPVPPTPEPEFNLCGYLKNRWWVIILIIGVILWSLTRC
jgi:hypothetical protein